LIGRYDHPLDPREIVQWLQRHDHLDCRAIGVGDDAALCVLRNRMRIDLRHDQRHIRFHAEVRGVVDHYGARLRRARCKFGRNLGPRRGKDDIDAAEIVSIKAFDPEGVILAERDLAADRPRRRQCDNVIGREFALGERGQEFTSDIAGCADHRYLETHIETPRRI